MCGHLTRAESHPAAVVRRQHERDVLVLASLLEGLTGPQKELAWELLEVVSRFGADPLLRLQDEDVAEMASSLASTLKTAARGVIYEHRPRSLVAQRLGADVRAFLERPERPASAQVVPVLERVAETFRDAARLTGEADPRRGLAAVDRAMRAASTAARARTAASPLASSPGPSLLRP